MCKLTGFLDDTRKGHWANVMMDNGDSCRIIISHAGVSVRKSKFGLFGSKLYEEKNIYKAAKMAETLGLLHSDDLTPAEMPHAVLKAFTNAVLHCRSLAEFGALLNEVSDYLQGRKRDVSVAKRLLGLYNKLRAGKGLGASDDIEEAAASVAAHMVSRLLPETAQSPLKSFVDSPGAVTGAMSAMLLCFVVPPLIKHLRQDGFALSGADVTGKSGLAIFHLYEEDEVARVIAGAARRYEALMTSREDTGINEFSDSVHRLVYAYIASGNERYLWILGKLYADFLHAHADYFQKEEERSASNVGKRRYRRFAVENMDVHAKTVLTAGIDFLNISTSGACIVTKTGLKSGDKYLIKLQCEGMHLSLPCVVIWESLCSGNKRSGRGGAASYKTGIAFKNMTSDKLVKLKDFIRVSGIPDARRLSDEYGPSALRFAVHSNRKAVLLYPKASPVRKISLGGVLVESNTVISVGKKFPMALLLPDEELPVRFRGRVASCIVVPHARPDLFHIGIEFLDMAPGDRSRVSRFLGRLEQRTESSDQVKIR